MTKNLYLYGLFQEVLNLTGQTGLINSIGRIICFKNKDLNVQLKMKEAFVCSQPQQNYV